MTRTKCLLISVGLYLIACASPALLLHVRHAMNMKIHVWDGYKTVRGIDLLFGGLVFGWMRLNFTAFANVPLWISWILLARRNFPAAKTAAAVALIMSLETLQLLVQPYVWDEGATAEGFLALPHIGMVCWVASMGVIWAYSRNAPLEMQTAAAH